MPLDVRSVMDQARENVRIAWRLEQRKTQMAHVAWENRRAILAASIYENSGSELMEATQLYTNRLDFAPDKEIVTRRQTDLELYEEWKSMFGKISSET